MRLRDSQLNKETLIPVVWRARVTVELELARQVKGAVQQHVRPAGSVLRSQKLKRIWSLIGSEVQKQ